MSREDAAPERGQGLRRLAWLLDDSIRIPWTRRRIGLESLLGLIPGVGDAVGGLLSTWILVQGVRYGASRTTLLRMLINVALEVVVGFIPVVGDVFDMSWKANQRNVQLLSAYLEQPTAAGRTSGMWLLTILAVLTLIGVGTLWAGIVLLRWLVATGSALMGG